MSTDSQCSGMLALAAGRASTGLARCFQLLDGSFELTWEGEVMRSLKEESEFQRVARTPAFIH